MNYVVAQLGARMHYAVPRILHDAGMLGGLYTDLCAVKGWPRLLGAVPARWRPGGLKRLLGRVPRGVPAAKIRTFSGFGLGYARRAAVARTGAERTTAYLWAGRRFCDLVLRAGLGDAEGVYTFNSAGLEVLRQARAQGRRAVMEQTIAPREVEEELLTVERERFPGWEPASEPDGALAAFCERERQEWAAADLILCGSEFVRQGIAACGGPVDRCAVVPYGVDGSATVPDRRGRSGPLRVLTVGAVGLRKGSPYVLEAARRMRGRAVFRMVGPLGVSADAERELRRHVEVIGPVPRSEIASQYAWSDVFLLPSVCEGSATVTYEALRCGLPVVCTPNTGSVIRDGVDGYLVPTRDPEAIVERLDRLAARGEWLAEMARRAAERAAEFTTACYGERLIAALRGTNGPDLLAG